MVARCSCGCPSIDLLVDESAPRSAHPGDPSLPLWASAGDQSDADDVVDISLWAPEGALTELNVAWYGDQAPAVLPDANDLVVSPGPEPTIVE